ncbi:hypothetical protein M9Y10_000906 [Tritrichomonas musculus]|uniref:Uncharacterized protein n=1 Tax=Tritrichomonas musculus TaxID=1915356 RepID=A0ABR2L5I5_9EUKA
MKDFEMLCQVFNDLFKTKSDTEKQNFEQTLNYVGLTFIEDEISVAFTDRWEEVSMVNGSKFKMPSTTNSIKSVH